jgi:nicotinate dehydrogenase subunit B
MKSPADASKRVVSGFRLRKATADAPEPSAEAVSRTQENQTPEIEIERYELSEPAPYRFEVERREFMRIFGAIGGGLLVVASVPSVGAQESGRGGQQRASADLAAWIHIDEKGHITGYTGKTEIGQNIRTSLAQAIADELRVPLSAVSLVMADTDLVPYDQGTFGSQSTPRMAPQLARAAAAAREILLDQAAALWKVDRATLTARDGRINGQGRSAGFGELTKGQKLAGVVAPETPVASVQQWTLRGTAPRKVDGQSFVTGQHRYTPDLARPGMLIGRVIRPQGYTGTLVSMDDSRARALPGVVVVRDGSFVGVVAPTERLARRAVAAVNVEWHVPSGLPTSQTIYEHLKKTEASAGRGGGRGGAPTSAGDVSAARAGAARTFDASYRIPYIAHVPLEPRSAVAEWADGKLTVWTGTQRPFGVRAELAEAFRLTEDRVRVIVPDTGSAYGGKHSGEYAIEAARLAKAAGKPVKLVWTRSEEFSFGYFRPAGVIDVRAAVNADGQLIAWEFDNWNSGASAIRTPYEVVWRRPPTTTCARCTWMPSPARSAWIPSNSA